MTNNNTLWLIAISALLFSITCSSTEKKTEPVVPPVVVELPKKEEPPVVQSRSVDTGATIEALNEKLAGVSMVGLPPFESSLSDKKLDSFGKNSLETAKTVVADMPEGYVIQITGHANQHPDKTKRVGTGLSVQRAKVVFDYFLKNGIAKEKLSYRGVGSSESDEKLSHANNRRVTFKVVKAGGVDEAESGGTKPKAEGKSDVKSEETHEVQPEIKPEVNP